ncbi:hypothetical protein EOS93_25160 [Rhizobium sp. RMa-01]|uniref:PBECR3 domain-containing polyvalent protein n=1 Tax=unclassified Rhizobium TaxID=2613769 RepID=UPI0008DB06F3|nr:MULTISPECIES: hypothetical protein [unclassified Rhizobium]OHV24949.1 hypothetical protein BBJ66_22675 [Rhizobium sp. RSm-3]RVU08345.1 hypothetical protein EOS93_25160 [Rhizobium sp. RMa-01]
MDITSDFDTWLKSKHDQDAASASVVIGSSAENPDEVAGNLNLANEFAKTTGSPVPPLDLVKDNRSSFQQAIDDKRNATVLQSSPRLTSWLTANPTKAAIAKDDLSGLSWWELLGKNAAEVPKGIPGGVVSSAGTALEGTGQILTPVDPAVRTPLTNRIVQAQSLAPDQLATLRQDIFKQGDINPQIAQTVLSGVLAGDIPPAEAIEQLGPMLGPALKIASDALQSGGEATQDFGAGLIPAAPGMEESLGRQVGSGLGSLLTIIGAAMVGGPFAAGGVGGAMGAGEASGNARRAGQDEDTQTIAAFWGLIPGLTDAIPVERLLNNHVVKSGFAALLRTVAKQFATEGGQEAVQQLMQNAIASNLYAPDKSLLDGVLNSFATGGFVGAMVEAGKIGIDAMIPGRLRGSMHQAQRAEQTRQTVQDLSAQAQASTTRGRSADTFRDFAAKATNGTPVENIYVPADKFVEYFQGAGFDPHELADTLDGVTSADLDAALASGGDLRIPTATYAARMAGSEHDAFLMDNMRFDPESFTFAEAQAFNERAEDLRDEAYQAAEDARQSAEANRSAEERIYDEMVSRLRVAGRSTDVATTEAMLYPAFYSAMAQRNGMTTEEFMQRYPLPQVAGDLPQGMQFKNVDELNRTLAAARNRKDVRDTRPTLLDFIDQHGGINDAGGELKSRNAETVKRGKGKKTLRLARKQGKAQGDMLGGSNLDGRKHGADAVAQAAIEAGFLRDDPAAVEYIAAVNEGREVPDITRALYDSIDRELRGEPQYAEAPSAEAEEAARLDEVEKYLASLGVSLTDSDDNIRQAIEGGRQYGQASVLRGAIQSLLDFVRGAPANETKTVELGQVSPEVAAAVKDSSGLDVSGYTHTVDAFAVRHIFKRHGDEKAETSRGQLPITEADILAIPDVITNATHVVTGIVGRRGQQIVGYLAPGPDGSTLYVEEAREGKKRLAAVSMRKFPPATKSESVISGLVSTSETPPGGEIKVTALPQNRKGGFLFQKMEGGARGSIQLPAGGIRSGDTIIRLFENADLSTLVHETGHYFLTVMQDATASGESSSAADFATLQDWWKENAKAVAADGKRVMADVEITEADVIAALENGTTGDLMKDAAVDVGMQEQFARAFESYLMEGKAPSIELRGAFEKFRSWLISIYRTIAGLHVKTSPAVTEVFNRMLASDSQIEAAQASTGETGPVFATAEAMGLKQEEFDRFMTLRRQAEDEAKATLLREAMAPIKREQQKAYKEEKAAVRAEVEKEVNAFRYYRAMEWMGNRRWIDEDGVKEMPDIRMSKDILVERYGAGILETLPRGKQTMYAVEGGHDPDDIANSFGFESGDEMVRALEQAPKRKDAIAAEVERVMRERHGDMLNDGSAEAEALSAVHNDKKAQWIAAELKAIVEVAGAGQALTAKEARASARSATARMRVRDAMASERFLAAERKAADEAARLGAQLAREKIWLDAARRKISSTAKAAIRGEGSQEAVAGAIDAHNGKFETTTSTFQVADQQRVSSNGKAFTIPGGERTVTNHGYNDLVAKLIEAKRRQLLNHALYQESRKVADEVEKAENYVKKLGKASTRNRIAGAGRRENAKVDYLGAIDELLDRYDFTRMSGTAEARRGSLNAFVEAMRAAGRENELVIPDAVLAQAGRAPYKTIPVEELRGVIDSIKNLEHVALRWNKLIDAKHERELEETVSDILDAFKKNMPKRPPARVGSAGEDRRNSVRQYLDLVLNANTLLREIDGFEDAGATHAAIKAPIDDAANRLAVRKEKAAADLETLYDVYSKKERRDMARRMHVPELGYALSKWEKIAIALNTGNEGNRQRLTDRRVEGSLTDAQVDAVLASLDARDAKFVQSVWDFVGSFKGDIAAREKRVTGVEPDWVQSSPVTIGGKELAGGYYPLKYDARLSSLARDDAAQDIAQSLMAGRFGKAQTRNGHTKERAQASGRPVELDMSVLHRHINQVIYDLEFSEAVSNSWRVLQDGRVRSAFTNSGRSADFDALETWLLDVGSGELRSADLVSRTARFAKNNFTVAKLALNLVTAASQVAGLAQSVVVVGKRDFAVGVKNSFRPGVLGDIASKSPYMSKRQGTFSKDINDFYESSKSSAAGSRWKDFKTVWGKLAFWLMEKLQYHLVDVPTWLGGYNQGLRKFGNDEAKAVAHADDIVKRAQSSGLFHDRSSFERGTLSRNTRQNDVVRLFTALGSYMFAKFNIAYERGAKARRNVIDQGSTPAAFAKQGVSLAVDMAMLFMVDAVFVAAIKGQLPTGDDDDDGWPLFLAKQTGFSVLGALPFIRDAGSVFQGFDGGGAYGSVVGDAAGGIKSLAGVVESLFKGEEVKNSDIKAIVNATGLGTGLPAAQVNRIVDAGMRQVDGQEVSPFEYLLGKSSK